MGEIIALIFALTVVYLLMFGQETIDLIAKLAEIRKDKHNDSE